MADYTKSMQALASERMGYLHVAVLEPEIFFSQLIRKSLNGIGISSTYLARDSREVDELLANKPVDILIVERNSKPENGLEVTRRLRAPDSPIRMLPIIITTVDNGPKDMEEIQNAGVTEIITKPFTIKGIANCVTTIIDQPRDFIIAPNYTGPDRRRVLKPLEAGVMERRVSDEPEILERSQANSVFSDDKPHVVYADFHLKHRVEAAAMGLSEGPLPANEVARRTDDFVQWMLRDLDTIRQNYRRLKNKEDKAEGALEDLTTATLSIRARGITSHYIFAARVASGLNDFCRRYFRRDIDHHLIVVQKHIDTLSAILNHRITGDENPIGRQLVEELKRLVYIYTPSP